MKVINWMYSLDTFIIFMILSAEFTVVLALFEF